MRTFLYGAGVIADSRLYGGNSYLLILHLLQSIYIVYMHIQYERQCFALVEIGYMQ